MAAAVGKTWLEAPRRDRSLLGNDRDGGLAPGLFVEMPAFLGGELDTRRQPQVGPQLGLVQGQSLQSLPFLGGQRSDPIVQAGDR